MHSKQFLNKFKIFLYNSKLTTVFTSAYDRWLLLAFSIFFILIHCVGFVWYLFAYIDIVKLKKREIIHIKEFNKQNEKNEDNKIVLKF